MSLSVTVDESTTPLIHPLIHSMTTPNSKPIIAPTTTRTNTNLLIASPIYRLAPLPPSHPASPQHLEYLATTAAAATLTAATNNEMELQSQPHNEEKGTPQRGEEVKMIENKDLDELITTEASIATADSPMTSPIPSTTAAAEDDEHTTTFMTNDSSMTAPIRPCASSSAPNSRATSPHRSIFVCRYHLGMCHNGPTCKFQYLTIPPACVPQLRTERVVGRFPELERKTTIPQDESSSSSTSSSLESKIKELQEQLRLRDEKEAIERQEKQALERELTQVRAKIFNLHMRQQEREKKERDAAAAAIERNEKKQSDAVPFSRQSSLSPFLLNLMSGASDLNVNLNSDLLLLPPTYHHRYSDDFKILFTQSSLTENDEKGNGDSRFRPSFAVRSSSISPSISTRDIWSCSPADSLDTPVPLILPRISSSPVLGSAATDQSRSLFSSQSPPFSLDTILNPFIAPFSQISSLASFNTDPNLLKLLDETCLVFEHGLTCSLTQPQPIRTILPTEQIRRTVPPSETKVEQAGSHSISNSTTSSFTSVTSSATTSAAESTRPNSPSVEEEAVRSSSTTAASLASSSSSTAADVVPTIRPPQSPQIRPADPPQEIVYSCPISSANGWSEQRIRASSLLFKWIQKRKGDEDGVIYFHSEQQMKEMIEKMNQREETSTQKPLTLKSPTHRPPRSPTTKVATSPPRLSSSTSTMPPPPPSPVESSPIAAAASGGVTGLTNTAPSVFPSTALSPRGVIVPPPPQPPQPKKAPYQPSLKLWPIQPYPHTPYMKQGHGYPTIGAAPFYFYNHPPVVPMFPFAYPYHPMTPHPPPGPALLQLPQIPQLLPHSTYPPQSSYQ